MATKETWIKIGCALVLVAAVVVGCETGSGENEGTISLSDLQGLTVPNTNTNTPPNTNTNTPPNTNTNTPPNTNTNTPPNTNTNTPPNTNTNAPANPGFPSAISTKIKWLNTDVSGWAQTASLSASVGGGTISMPYSKSRSWPAKDGVNANPWVIVKWTDGNWYAATFEYFKFGQTSKPVGVLDGSKGPHIQGSPLNQWRPRKGERFYLMVSGLARSSARNVKERSNASLVTWP